MKFFKDSAVRAAGVGVALVAPMMAHAAVDTSEITATLTDIAAVGAAVFAVMVGIRLYKWIRRAL